MSNVVNILDMDYIMSYLYTWMSALQRKILRPNSSFRGPCFRFFRGRKFD